VYVATPDKEIADVVNDFGGKVILTGQHDTMLDRCSEAARRLKGYSHIVVSQGDEPMVRYEMIDLAVGELIDEITCLCKAILPGEDPYDPNMVKAIFDKNRYYMYFSRSVLPGFTPEKDGVLQTNVYKQVGIMCFTTQYLAMYGKLERLAAEKSEGIDLLRYLEHGYKVIRAIETPYDTQCVDTPEDLEKVRRMM
jgi:3-deoxy-manno-octulosonate cytidylyltransferase (CMP-KDO synthetase)